MSTIPKAQDLASIDSRAPSATTTTVPAPTCFLPCLAFESTSALSCLAAFTRSEGNSETASEMIFKTC